MAHHTTHHTGGLVHCMDRRVNKGMIAEAAKEIWGKEVATNISNSYIHANAGNKLYGKNDPTAAAMIALSGGKQIAVIGHTGVCGGMKFQHDLHKMGPKYRAAMKKNEIHGWVGRDIPEFKPIIGELQKRMGLKEYKKFLQTDEYRELMEEFNVLVQLSKLAKRPDFKKAVKEHKGEITLLGGMYHPKEEVAESGKKEVVQGTLDTSFSLLNKHMGAGWVEKYLKNNKLAHDGTGKFTLLK